MLKKAINNNNNNNNNNKRDSKDLEIKDKSGTSCCRCIGFSVKEAGRPLGATRN